MISRIRNISNWGFVSGRISVLEARFLSREFLLNIINQERIEDAIPHLQDTFLKDYLNPGFVWEDFGSLFDKCFYDIAISLKNDCPSPVPVDIFLIQNDYLNLKKALTGNTDFPFSNGLFSQESLLAAAHGDYADLPEALRESAGWNIIETFDVDAGTIDIMLDGAYLRHLMILAKKLKSEMISAYVNDRVLASVVIILWRASKQGHQMKHYQQYLLPLEDFTSIALELMASNNPETWPSLMAGTVIGGLLAESIDLDMDDQIAGFGLRVKNHLTGIARDGKLQTAGPERVFAFLFALFVEMQNLKLVVNGRINRIGREMLKERFKDCYV